MVPDLLLEMGEVYGDELHPPGVLGHLLEQALHLLPGQLAGVRGACEVDRGELHPPLGHHPGGHRAVQAAADQNGRPAPGAHGDAPGSRLGVGVDVGVLLPDLHPHGDVRGVDVYREMGEFFQQVAPHLGGDLRGLEGELLVAALALHLKGRGLFQGFLQVLPGLLLDLPQVLFADPGPGHPHHAEDLAAALLRQVHVAQVVLGLHVDGGLPGGHGKLPRGAHPPPDVLHQGVLELPPVQPLQGDLAQF